MKYILDASVALKWVLAEQDSDKAIRLRDDARAGVDELIAPDFFPAECGHGLFRAERRRLIAGGDARQYLGVILTDCPLLQNCVVLLPRAAIICEQLRIGFYDTLYMALAEAEGCQFVTADTRLVKNVQSGFPYVIDLAAFP